MECSLEKVIPVLTAEEQVQRGTRKNKINLSGERNEAKAKNKMGSNQRWGWKEKSILSFKIYLPVWQLKWVFAVSEAREENEGLSGGGALIFNMYKISVLQDCGAEN